jgi:serine/threonine protein kinase
LNIDPFSKDVSPNNILLGIHDPALLPEIERAEIIDPAPRKTLASRTIYYSRRMPLTHGSPVISDFGMARVGDSHRGDIMPDIYRASEVILGMEWSYPVDIWAVGLMVRLIHHKCMNLVVGHHYLPSFLHSFGTSLREQASSRQEKEVYQTTNSTWQKWCP